MKKKALFVLLGQSNAVGHIVPMAEEDKILVPMKNVFGLHRKDNQKLDLEKVIWSGYTSDGMNLGETQDHTWSLANCLAKYWQKAVDAGKDLPDLYIVQIAIGAHGVAPQFMWHPDREPVLIPGTLSKVNISLYPFTMHILSLVKESLGEFDQAYVHWRGGEQDMAAVFEDPSIDLQSTYQRMVNDLNKVLGDPTIVFHKIVAKDRMAEEPTGTKARIMADINAIFECFTETGNATIFDPRMYPGFDPNVMGEGIFQEDNIHFKAEVNQWVAKQIFHGYTAKYFQGAV